MSILSHRVLIEVAKELSKEKELKVTIKKLCEGATLAAGGAFIGGLLGGLLGMAIGGTLGATLYSSDEFKSVADVTMEDMIPAQRTELANRLGRVLESVDVVDVLELVELLMNNLTLEQAFTNVMSEYFSSELRLPIAF